MKKLFKKVSDNRFLLNENGHGETDMSNPEENREVQIGREILSILDMSKWSKYPDIQKVIELSKELLTMHGVK
jgi:hypothetical protein